VQGAGQPTSQCPSPIPGAIVTVTFHQSPDAVGLITAGYSDTSTPQILRLVSAGADPLLGAAHHPACTTRDLRHRNDRRRTFQDGSTTITESADDSDGHGQTVVTSVACGPLVPWVTV